MSLVILLFILVFGLIIGSFIGAYSWRYPRGISIAKGRSICGDCKKQIAWYDNLPVISFLILGGKCRNCKKKISIREPMIEIGTAFAFGAVFILQQVISKNIGWTSALGMLELPMFLLVTSLMIIVFVTDLEHMIIPDEVVLIGVVTIIVSLMVVRNDMFFQYLLAGFSGSLFLLAVNLLTKGKGMGLGDVKLAIFGGALLGLANSLIWFFVSFLIGGVYASMVLLLKKVKLKQEVPFGPFLIIGLVVVVIFGVNLRQYVYPWL